MRSEGSFLWLFWLYVDHKFVLHERRKKRGKKGQKEEVPDEKGTEENFIEYLLKLTMPMGWGRG